jgi:nucleolar protein 53
MGRKLQGAKLRAKKRGTEADKELVEIKAQHAETQHVTEKADEELFVIDNTAVLPSKKTLHKKEKKLKYSNSAKEQSQIEKLAAKFTKDQLERMTKTKTARRAMNKGAVDPKFDLWASEGEKAAPQKKKTSAEIPAIGSTLAGIKPAEHTKIATTRALRAPKADRAVQIDPANSGQSYNPDKVSHKKAILEAVEVERKRGLAEKDRKAPISTGMSAETRKYIVDDTDSEDDEPEDDQDDALTEDKMEKKKEKFTRAQRNKQKRLRAEQWEIDTRKRNKKFEGSVGEAKTITKKLRKEETHTLERKLEIEKKKKESEPVKGKDVYGKMSKENPIAAPTYPVALSNELKSGSLRTIISKGSLLTDRFASLRDREMAPKKALKKNKRMEGKRRRTKIKVKGKGFKEAREGQILG